MKKFFVLIIVGFCLSNIFMSLLNSENVYAEGNISAQSYIVIDKNGKVLSEKNCDEKREVASICKLMTTLITLEEIDAGNISLDDYFLASEYACSIEGSQAFLDAGQKYTVRELLKSVIIASANDSAIVLAENIAGSESQFVEMMNNKAQKLGMHNTIYSNSTGLSGDEQYSTARDTAIILNIVSEYSFYQENCKIWMDKLIHPSGRETELVNTNRLIKYYPYCVTGKTGYTDNAGYCLSSTALNNNLKLTCVVLGCQKSSDRFTESVMLYNNAFSNFVCEKVVDKNISIPNNIQVLKGKTKEIEILAEKDFYLTLNKREKENYRIEYIVSDKISAPISKGDIVGELLVFVDDQEYARINLISNSTISKQGYKDIVSKIIDNFAIIK